jgi:HlyD family secretion protein
MRIRTIAALTAGALLAGLLAWRAMQSDPVEVVVGTVERGSVRSSVSNTRAGTVNACDRARLAPTRGGQIAALPVKEGDAVEAGQILLELWNDDIRASLQLAREERLAAESRAEEACTAAEVAQRDATRVEQLRERELTSEGAADTASGTARAREAACQAARRLIAVSEAQIALIQAQLEQTVVRAPFAGTIAEINGEVGEVVTPSPVGVPTLPAIDLIDNSCLYVTAPIDEVDAPRIRAGMRASITLDAFPDQSFPATVRRVAPYVLDLEKQARTVDIEAEFDEPCDNLLPGYSADVEVTLDEHFDVLHVPTQAVLDGNRVLVLNAAGRLESRDVETGLGNWEVTEVVAGLREGERVVLSVDRDGVVPGATAVAAGDST